MTHIPSAKEAAEAIGIPTEEWVGKCYEIACAIIDSGVIGGRPAYGHYLGPISPDCPIAMESSPIHPHGWIVLGDGSIVDPTRWVWTSTEPELWLGSDGEYDEGGNIFRRSHMPSSPAPSGRVVEIYLPDHIRVMIGVSPGGDITLGHLMWLANLPPTEITPANVVYRSLSDAGLRALIPIDNYRMVMGI